MLHVQAVTIKLGFLKYPVQYAPQESIRRRRVLLNVLIAHLVKLQLLMGQLHVMIVRQVSMGKLLAAQLAPFVLLVSGKIAQARHSIRVLTAERENITR